MNRLVEMDAFVRVINNGNFLAAASELGVSAGLVTRRVKELESDLGVRLISRTTRRLSLTEAGERYYKFCRRVLKEIREEENGIKQLQQDPIGRLKVVASMSFGIMEMGKAVTTFMQQYPAIQVTLIISEGGRRPFDPSEYDADLAIRFTRPRNSTLSTRRIGTMDWVACGAPAYLRKMGIPKKPDELVNHSCLVTSTPFGDGRWKFRGRDGEQTVEVTGVVSPSSAISMRYMVLDGAGIALLPAFCVAEDIRKRSLVRILSNYEIPNQPICAYYPHGRQQPKKISLFLDFLAARFKNAAWNIGP